MQRVDGVDNDIVVSTDDQGGLVDVFEIGETLAGLRSPVTHGRNLGRRHVFIDGSVAVFGA